MYEEHIYNNKVFKTIYSLESSGQMKENQKGEKCFSLTIGRGNA